MYETEYTIQEVLTGVNRQFVTTYAIPKCVHEHYLVSLLTRPGIENTLFMLFLKECEDYTIQGIGEYDSLMLNVPYDCSELKQKYDPSTINILHGYFVSRDNFKIVSVEKIVGEIKDNTIELTAAAINNNNALRRLLDKVNPVLSCLNANVIWIGRHFPKDIKEVISKFEKITVYTTTDNTISLIVAKLKENIDLNEDMLNDFLIKIDSYNNVDDFAVTFLRKTFTNVIFKLSKDSVFFFRKN